MTEITGRRPARELVVAGVVAAGMLLATVVVAVTPVGARWNGDLQLYHHYAGTFLDGFVSKTPFLSWYPPLTLVPIALPRLLAPDLPTYTFLFGLEMSIAAGGLVLVAAHVGAMWPDRRLASRSLPVLVALLALTAIILPWRFDALPALATAGAFLAAMAGAPLTAGALLGVGTALKLYPAVLLPPLLLWLWLRREPVPAAKALVGFAALAGAGLGLYLLFPPASPVDLLAFQGGRGLQLESLTSSGVAVMAVLGLLPHPAVAFGDGSYNLLGAAADVGLRVSTVLEAVLLVVALAATGWSYWRTRGVGTLPVQALTLGMVAALLALILGNRVFSPQYVIWLLPFAPFLPGRLRWLVLGVFALTALIFPFVYDALIRLEPLPVALLVARNAALVVLFAGVVRRLLLTPGVETPAYVAEAALDSASARL